VALKRAVFEDISGSPHPNFGERSHFPWLWQVPKRLLDSRRMKYIIIVFDYYEKDGEKQMLL
jgi:hypothetical protein